MHIDFPDLCRRLNSCGGAATLPSITAGLFCRNPFHGHSITVMALFFPVDLVPLAPQTRAALVDRLGARGYQAAFSPVSAVGLGLMVWGYWMSRAGPAAADIVYGPPDWARPVTMTLVFLAFLSFGIYLHKGRLKVWLGNPMSIAIALWAAGHLISNGKMSSVLLFGAFPAYALIDIGVNTARERCRPSWPTPATTMWRCSRACCCSYFSCSSSTPMCSTCLSFDEARGHWSCGAAPQQIG